MVLSTLAELGAKFSCQNKLELELLSKVGIPAEDIFFGSSVKVASHLRLASSCGVDVMAFETAAEIHKIQKNSPNARSETKLSLITGLRFLKKSS
jgi:ornithine decarboxylase